ncbi:transcription factor MYB101-like [Lotus japonicus]|uniref:transcription factor MYB101-like n=1 Tax=Lotus japonicus TaxID=34305 RepID=UPI00258C4449|nr:transcription factor MYB101-like [Lotus japonicus]
MSLPSSSNGKGKSTGRDNDAEEDMRKGPWTPEEDEILAAYVIKHGEGNWNIVQNNTGLYRCGKSCRLRWTNHLRPNLRKGPFSKDEQRVVVEMHARLGNKWSKMAQQLPGRTDNEIKNFWHTRRKKLERVKMPLYPPHLKVLHDDQGCSSRQQPNASPSQEDEFEKPEEKFKTQKPSQEHPPYTPSIGFISESIPPSIGFISESIPHEQASDSPIMPPSEPLHDSDILYYNSLGTTSTDSGLLDYYEFQDDCWCGRCDCLSRTPFISLPMVSELPPFPGEETYQEPVYESFDTMAQYQSEPVSPRSSGLLESIFYPPKILDGSDNNFSAMNPCETRLDDVENKNQNQREETSVEPNTEASHDKYESATMDSLFEIAGKSMFPGP